MIRFGRLGKPEAPDAAAPQAPLPPMPSVIIPPDQADELRRRALEIVAQREPSVPRLSTDSLDTILSALIKEQPIFVVPAEGKEFRFAPEIIEEAVTEAVSRLKPRIPEFWGNIPMEYRAAIERIAQEEQADQHQIAAEWLIQRQIFLELGKHFQLESVAEIQPADLRAFLLLTLNGSMLAGQLPHLPAPGSTLRFMQYLRLPSRKSSWKGSETEKDASLQASLRVGFPAVNDFLHTSPVQYLFVFKQGDEQQLLNITHTVSHATHSVVVNRQKAHEAWRQGKGPHPSGR